VALTPPPYSSRHRTALVLVGTGTAGAYHAGVLRALHEAGVRIDLVAGRGMGAVSAMFAAVDAGSRLWDEKGMWADPRAPRRLYRWKRLWGLAGLGLAVAAVALLGPLAWLLLAAVAYPVAFLAQLVAPAAGEAIAAFYTDLITATLGPAMLSTVVPRVAALGVALFALAVLVGGTRALLARRHRRTRGPFWARAFGAPFDAGHAVEWATSGFWQFIRGAASIAQPGPADLARRYAELLTENLGQPGYRELVLTVHDLDARRDLVFALLAEPYRRGFASPVTRADASRRLAELGDLAGVAAEHVMDALAGALAVPVVSDPHPITFASESHWRGETHRLADRPAAITRLLEEVAAAGAEQVLVVSAVHDLAGPHALSAQRLDLRARVGDYVMAAEAAALRDAVAAHAPGFAALYEIRPLHNPVGPFDFAGGYDDRSDRVQGLRELMNRGYEDAYRQFIEPMVGASGEAIRGTRVVRRVEDLPINPSLSEP
jgi:hypothetical protein